MTKQELILNDNRYTPLHQHGFVGLIDTMGNDHDIAAAARVSYGAGTKSVNDDRNLIRYLVRHKHTSPLEMAEVKFHLKLPIFVMRQLVRHRTANLNEYSARYSVLSDEFYVPSEDYLAPQSKTNKQGRAGAFSNFFKLKVGWAFKTAFEATYTVYTALLGEDRQAIRIGDDEYGEFSRDDYPGLSRELARIIIPTANYTECYWKCDLHNFFHFARLRMDSHAQQEIRDFATSMYNLVKPHFPLAAQAFEDYILNGVSLSAMDLIALQDMLNASFVPSANHYGMSTREFNEFLDRWKPSDRHLAEVSRS